MDILTSDDRILIDTKFPVPADQVWAGLTAPEALLSWWGKYVHLDPRLGGDFRETWKHDGGHLVTTTGTVTTFDPPHALALTWADEGWPQATRVRITLAPQPDGRTLLRLVHEGWAPWPDAERAALIEAHIDGWTYHLRSLMGYFLRQEGLL